MQTLTKIHSFGELLVVEAINYDGNGKPQTNALSAVVNGDIEDAEDRARQRVRSHGSENATEPERSSQKPAQAAEPEAEPEEIPAEQVPVRDDDNPEWVGEDMEELAEGISTPPEQTQEECEGAVPDALRRVLRDCCEQDGVTYREPSSKAEAAGWIRMIREDGAQELPDLIGKEAESEQ